MRRLGYLATPYSSPDPIIRQQRFLDTAYIAAQLMVRGKYVVAPILIGHPMAMSPCNLPTDFDFWSEFDENLIVRCDYMAIAKLPGWDVSAGIHEEVIIAQSRQKEILLVNLTKELKVVGFQTYRGELDG